MYFARNFARNKYVNKLMDTATKTGKDFEKKTGKRVINKKAEATGDFVVNKMADKITSKPRSKKEKDEAHIMEETQEMMIPPERRDQIIKDLRLF